mmetsp:Transcript_22510/g.64788  ORF Transcript_22510/g.64788 Transcript_22510/m.64788 type:complete len:263 (-) Transcript_22510:1650-2438(-)
MIRRVERMRVAVFVHDSDVPGLGATRVQQHAHALGEILGWRSRATSGLHEGTDVSPIAFAHSAVQGAPAAIVAPLRVRLVVEEQLHNLVMAQLACPMQRSDIKPVTFQEFQRQGSRRTPKHGVQLLKGGEAARSLIADIRKDIPWHHASLRRLPDCADDDPAVRAIPAAEAEAARSRGSVEGDLVVRTLAHKAGAAAKIERAILAGREHHRLLVNLSPRLDQQFAQLRVAHLDGHPQRGPAPVVQRGQRRPLVVRRRARRHG